MVRLVLLVDGDSVTVESSTPVTDSFKAPSLDEVKEYWTSEGLRGSPVVFHTFYGSKGWTSKGSPVRDWHRLAVSWSNQERGSHSPVGTVKGGAQW